jgi:large repetitive protein
MNSKIFLPKATVALFAFFISIQIAFAQQHWWLSGTIANEAGIPIDDVKIDVYRTGSHIDSILTRANGWYSIYWWLPTDTSKWVITARKDTLNDIREGVSMADIAAISRHVLGLQTLDSPYKLLAADVDGNGEIDANDMLQIRRLVLQRSPTLPAGNFRFVPKAYVFQNPTNPFQENIPNFIAIPPIPTTPNISFIAIKMGDVNFSYRHVSAR